MTILHPSLVRLGAIQCALIAGLLVGCAGQAPVESVERQDERTGITVATLAQPLTFTETGIYDPLAPDQAQATMIYLGPVAWDRMGNYSYLLWVQLAPGVGGHRIDDIRARGAIRLQLDDGPVELTALTMPTKVGDPYPPIAPVGETAYFTADGALLRRMAASRRISLKIRAADLTPVDFLPLQETRGAFEKFVIDQDLVEPLPASKAGGSGTTRRP
jgi:hypothetical protein